MSGKPINRRRFIQHLGSSSIALALGGLASSCDSDSMPYPDQVMNTIGRTAGFSAERPNIIIINADDLGYGDLGCYGGRAIRTNNIDRIAENGIRFTDFYACDSVCTPSRAGLLTGRYPVRMDFCYPIYAEDKTFKQTLLDQLGKVGAFLSSLDIATRTGPGGLHRHEITIAEALKTAGYETGMVGKWHLGDYSVNPDYNPQRHGFDYFFGVPHSNDMVPFPLYRNEEELKSHIEEPDQARLTGLYTEEAIRFIASDRKSPFFLYLAHTFPHRPLYASEPFQNKSSGGTYGDTVEELDWSVGEILRTLRKHQLDRKTLLIFTSDNGPWYQGSAGSLRGRKGQSWEGGQRIPFLASWPGHIKPGLICREPAMNIDLLPSCLNIAGLTLPTDRIIDGRDITNLLTVPGSKSPHDELFFYHIGELEGIRSGRWKYIRNISHYTWPMPLNKRMGSISKHTRVDLPLLFDLKTDPGESYNVINRNPGIGEQLQQRLTAWESTIESNPLGFI